MSASSFNSFDRLVSVPGKARYKNNYETETPEGKQSVST